MSNDTNDAMVQKLCRSRLAFLIRTGKAAYDLSRGPTESKQSYIHAYSTQNNIYI